MLRAQLAASAGTPPPAFDSDDIETTSLWQEMRVIAVNEGPWWACSFVIHLVVLLSVALLGGTITQKPYQPDEVLESFVIEDPAAAAEELETKPFERINISPEKLQPDPETIDPKAFETLIAKGTGGPSDEGGSPDGSDDSTVLISSTRERAMLGSGGASSFAGQGSGPQSLLGRPGPYRGPGTPDGDPEGENPLIRRVKKGLGLWDGVTITGVKRVALALNWLARHQLPDGSWSLQGYVTRCGDATCTGPGSAQADSAATAMGLLPFLAAGKTHRIRGVYQTTVRDGLQWLVRHQKSDGDLRCGSTMYAHALATICLCEAFGMTGDQNLRYPAQAAVDFLQAAQNKRTGGWRYQPGDEGDLSVVGWQVMALKSAEMAGLGVKPAAFQRAGEYLKAVSSGGSSSSRGLFAYQPGQPPTSTMTSVGLLCSQYLGAGREDPGMREGTAHLMAHMPDTSNHDLYYWYYATQVMHNQPGPDWDAWNRKIRELLCETQNLKNCAAGSWDPDRPVPDHWGKQGGRLMMTSLAALTLEVYYRYIPLYKFQPGRAGEGGGD